MPYPRRANTSEILGYYYDWVNAKDGISKRAQPFMYVPEYFQGQMPLNHSNKRRNGRYIEGHGWVMLKERTWYSPGYNRTYRPNAGVAYEGGYIPLTHAISTYHLRDSLWGTPGYISWAKTALNGRGAEAWNALKPSKPDFTLASSVYELKDPLGVYRDRLKKVIKKTREKRGGKSFASKAAEFNLAVQFGYIPLLNDIRKYVKAQRGAQTRLAQLIRDEGRPVRRRRTLPTLPSESGSASSSWTSTGSETPFIPSHVTQCFAGPAKYEGYSAKETSVWTEGKMRYLLPPGPKTVRWKKRVLNRIMGSRITPSTLYNIMPWSWLVDYFTDLGQFIEAVSGGVEDRLICDYAYIMMTIRWTNRTTASKAMHSDLKGQFPKTVVGSRYSERVTKIRTFATPFGFGVKASSLTPRQIGILGSLGLSRLP